MNNAEISRYIHEKIMDKCWHVDIGKTLDDEECRCGFTASLGHLDSYNPDYCSDKSPRGLLNEVVEKVGELNVFGAFCDLVTPSPVVLLTATAEQIARACVEAHKRM